MSEEKIITEVTEFDKALEDIIKKLIENGQLIIVGTKGHGKTSTAMHIIRKLLNTKEHDEGMIHTLILDMVLQWRFRFDKIPYIDHANWRFPPKDVKELLIDFPYSDTRLIKNSIEDIVRNDYVMKRQMIEKLEGKIPLFNVYVIEEIQNILGSYSMNGVSGQFWLKMVSECRNYGMFIIGLGQRLADISTKVIERTRYYLLGATSGDNDLQKIRRMAGKQIADEVANLKKGEFIWLDRENKEYFLKIYFPKFEQNGKPYPYEGERNGKGYIRKIFRG